MLKRKAVVDYGIDYGLHNMHGMAGLYYVSNPVSCIIIYAHAQCGVIKNQRDRGCIIIDLQLWIPVASAMHSW